MRTTHRLLAAATAVLVLPHVATALDRSDLEWAKEVNETAATRGEELLEQHPNTALEQDIQAKLDSYDQSKLQEDAERMLSAMGTSNERQTAKEILEGYDRSKAKKDAKEILENHGEFIRALEDSPELTRKERRQLREAIRRVDDL
jgi:hypothetical protein